MVDEAAAANGVSKSRWVADIICEYAAQEWPQDCMALAGRFTDFPLREQAPPASEDAVRENPGLDD